MACCLIHLLPVGRVWSKLEAGLTVWRLELRNFSYIQVLIFRCMVPDSCLRMFSCAILVKTPRFILNLLVNHAFYLIWHIAQWDKCNWWFAFFQDIVNKAKLLSPRAVIIDSIQTVYLEDVSGSAGAISQVELFYLSPTLNEIWLYPLVFDRHSSCTLCLWILCDVLWDVMFIVNYVIDNFFPLGYKPAFVLFCIWMQPTFNN